MPYVNQCDAFDVKTRNCKKKAGSRCPRCVFICMERNWRQCGFATNQPMAPLSFATDEGIPGVVA
jgi:hypothetical protein